MDIVKIKENGVRYLNELCLLYRRGKPEHINALYEKGEVYINTIDFIRNCDDNEDRSDPNDGTLKREYWGEGKITLAPYGLDFDQHGVTFDASNFVITTDHAERGNIYCLTGLYTKDLAGKSGERPNLEFNTESLGESLILFDKPRLFIQRVLAALKDKGFENIQYGPIEYHTHDYSGNVGFFRKHEKFAFQKEYRFFVPNKLNEPIKVSIGSLEDIAYIGNNRPLYMFYSDNKQQIIKIG